MTTEVQTRRFRDISPPTQLLEQDSSSIMVHNPKNNENMARNTASHNQHHNSSRNASNNSCNNNRPSWRSMGWAPLAYPSAALFQTPDANVHTDFTGQVYTESQLFMIRKEGDNNIMVTKNNEERGMALLSETQWTAPSSTSSITSSRSDKELRRNPYFPLHRDVILAATRELLILDGSVDNSTMEAVNPETYLNGDNLKKIGGKAAGSVSATQTLGSKSKTMKTISPLTQETVMAATTDNNAPTCSSSVPPPPPPSLESVEGGVKRKYSEKEEGSTPSTSSVTFRHTSFLASLIRNSLLQKKNETESSPLLNDNSTHGGTLPISSNESENDSKRIKFNKATEEVKVNPKQKEIKIIIPSAETMAYNLLKRCVVQLSEPLEKHYHNSNNGHDDGILLPVEEETVPSMIQCGKVQEDGSHPNTQTHTSNIVVDAYNKPIRKVSDADANSVSGATFLFNSDISPHLAVAACNYETHTIDLKESIDRLLGRVSGATIADVNSINEFHQHGGYQRNSCDDPCDEEKLLLQLREDFPPLLDVSIMVETHLRHVAYQMTERLTEVLDEKALRVFLGYKSTAMKKDRMLQLLSDYLFDVSHAMFAWDQTEIELFGPRGRQIDSRRGIAAPALSSTISATNAAAVDERICKSLFDDRALKKIGGFNSSSLLNHALSIKRLRAKGISWRAFTMTTGGKKLFRHHRDIQKVLQVGLTRRGQRTRRRKTSMVNAKDLTGTRSRSSSIASSDGSETKQSMPNRLPCELESSSVVHTDTKINTGSNLIPITLNREQGKNWGIQLVRDGSMCVVNRAPDSSDTGSNNRLELGDLIISMRNEANETFRTPSGSYYHSNGSSSSDWFGEAVSLFKSSKMVHLEVRRVGSMPFTAN